MQFWRDFFVALKDNLFEEIKIGDIGHGIREAIVPRTLFTINIGGFSLAISDAALAAWLSMLIIFGLAWWLARKKELIPESGRQQLSESLVDLLYSLCRSANMNEEQAESVVPFVGTIALFITFSNLLSLVKIPPPAKNPAFPIALALLTIGYVIIQSIRFTGAKKFWSAMLYPRKMLLPFKILDFLIKPLSLSLRLFGNVFGAFILMEFIFLVIPVFLPGLFGLWFDLADGILQGAIFTYLTITYIGEILESAHLADEARKGKEKLLSESKLTPKTGSAS